MNAIGVIVFIVLVLIGFSMGLNFQQTCLLIMIGCVVIAVLKGVASKSQKTTNDDNQPQPKSPYQPKVSPTDHLETTMTPKRAIQTIIEHYQSKDYGWLGRQPTIEIDADHNKVLIKSAFENGLDGCTYGRTYDICASQKSDSATEVAFYVSDRLGNTPNFWNGQIDYPDNFPRDALERLRKELKLALYKSEP